MKQYLLYIDTLKVAIVFQLLAGATALADDPYTHSFGAEKAVRLGVINSPAEYDKVMAPTGVVDDAKRVLSGRPKTWKVNNIKKIYKTNQHIVLLSDSKHQFAIYQIKQRNWVRINHRPEIAAISEILKKELSEQTHKGNEREVINYLESVAFLYKGPQRIVMSKNFLQIAKTQWYMWLNGLEKRSRIFGAMCHDPLIVKRQNTTVIEVNIITDMGAVEMWRLSVDPTRQWRLQAVDIKLLCPPKTFSFGFIGQN